MCPFHPRRSGMETEREKEGERPAKSKFITARTRGGMKSPDRVITVVIEMMNSSEQELPYAELREFRASERGIVVTLKYNFIVL